MTGAELAIGCTWIEETPTLRDRGLERTMAEVTIRVGETVLTRHARGSSVHTAVVVPALPIATWFARRWVDLLDERIPLGGPRPASPHEVLRHQPPDDDDAEIAVDRWARAHALRSAGDGLLLPDVMFLRHGDAMSVGWETWSPEPALDFVGSGIADVPLEQFVRVVRAFVDEVWGRVEGLPRTFTRVSELERARQNLSASWSDRPWALLARRLGRTEESMRAFLGNDAEEPERAKKKIAQAYGVIADVQDDPVRLDSPIAQAARSTGPSFSESDHAELLRLGERLRASVPATALARLRQQVADENGGDRSHRGAYRRATAVRAKLLLPSARHIDIEQVLSGLGCVIEDGALEDHATDGVALWSQDGRALVFVNEASPRSATTWGRRSLLAHELYHLLFDARDVRFFGEATGDAAPSPTEPAANAFAAELLLPTKALPANAGSLYWADIAGARSLVRKLCKEFDVGWELVVRQLQNRRHLPPPIVELLLAVIED